MIGSTRLACLVSATELEGKRRHEIVKTLKDGGFTVRADCKTANGTPVSNIYSPNNDCLGSVIGSQKCTVIIFEEGD